MFQAIANILGSALSLWEHENSIKYQKKLYKLQKEYDAEKDKSKVDRNTLDHIERNVLRLSNLTHTEIKRSKADSL